MISNHGIISSDTFASGNAGDVTLKAGSLDIETGGSIESSATPGSIGNAGQLTVTTTGATTISNGGFISSDTHASGTAGDVTLTAGSLNVDGGGSTVFTGIASSADPGSSGNAGKVTINTTGATTISNNGEILSDTSALGAAGDVTLTAGSLNIDGVVGSTVSTGIGSSAERGSSGNAGQVSVTTNGATTITNGASIDSATYGPGNAGDVTIKAGSLMVAGTSTADSSISTTAYLGSSGNAGQVTVTTTGATTLSNGGYISSDTHASGSAGDVTLTAGSLNIDAGGSTPFTGIDSSAEHGSSGNAGTVTVTTTGATALSNNGQILSVTFASGNAGDVTLNAGSLNIDGLVGSTIATGIGSSAEPGSSGNAGKVSVTTSGATTVTNSGSIISATYGSGSAGDVALTAGSLTVEDGTANIPSLISTTAFQGSSGAAGSVTVDVSGTAKLMDYGNISSASRGAAGQPGTVAISAGTLFVGDEGVISINNYSSVADPTRVIPTQIDIHAGAIQMDEGQISAASGGNIAASAIDISYQQTLHMDPSIISTASNQGNGGPITITGQGPLWLQNSSITTSVFGRTNGNGGDIRITVPYIVLDSGFIQANTTAPKASGGDVVITDDALVTSFGSYFVGGSIENLNSANLSILGENVVQAAAPDGLSGTLTGTKPTLDFGSALLGLTGTPSAPIAVSRSLCTYRLGSSLAIAGRGGLPVSYRDPLWIELDATAGAEPGAAPTAQRSVSDPPLQGLSFIACR
jgi:large exoprotein involved in heme utilization and adhesion